jgi:hypothetical protein
MILKFRYCKICKTVNEMNYTLAKGGCKTCKSLFFEGVAPLTPLQQWVYILLRPFYWPHLIRGDK